MTDIWLIIPCAGKGSRFGAAIPKQYAQLLGKTVIEQTLSCFQQRDDIKGILIPHAPDDDILASLAAVKAGLVAHAKIPLYLLEGGKERSDSVYNALQFLQQLPHFHQDDSVAVHDAARPCVDANDLDQTFALAENNKNGAILATAAVDTIKVLNQDKCHIKNTIDRDVVALAQTPQVFRYQDLRQALFDCKQRAIVVTDEASAMEACGFSPQVYLGKKSNIKITTADDLALAAFFIQNNKHKQA